MTQVSLLGSIRDKIPLDLGSKVDVGIRGGNGTSVT